jgi:hypothetical protein
MDVSNTTLNFRTAEDDEDDEDNPFWLIDYDQPEHTRLCLPSGFGMNLPVSMNQAKDKEIRLRIGQANDALMTLRVEIGHKSFLFRNGIRLSKSKKEKTRGWAAVNHADQEIRFNMKKYRDARWALSELGADPKLFKQFQVLNKSHCNALESIYNPNAPGQRNSRMSWIWNLDVAGDSAESTHLDESKFLEYSNWL